MPLVIMCGFPLSGKSYFVDKLKSYIEEKENKKVIVVSDDNCGLLSEKHSRYKESRFEKELRAKLKSLVQNYINEKDVIILDSLNYIKGYRYELFCIAKSRSTPHCVIHCNTDETVCRERNDNMADAAATYPADVLDGLLMRFESPIATNRWDSPLFEIGADCCDSIYGSICEALFRSTAPVPNKATQSPVASAPDYLQQIEHTTQAVVKFIGDMQKTLPPGTSVAVPGASSEQFVLRRYQTVAELQRSRRQFIASFCRVRNNNSSVSHATDIGVDNLADSFVIYLNKCS